MMSKNIYVLQPIQSEVDASRFVFVSDGYKKLIKVVEYSFLMYYKDMKIYNLGFGNYNLENETIEDDSNSNNGDVYKVFNTVLSTILIFFELRPDGMIMVRGSDGNEEFVAGCKLNCNKNCKANCRNFNRRLKVYRGFIDKHYGTLIDEYSFYGGLKTENGISKLEVYDKKSDYHSIFLKKNNKFEL